MKKAVTIICLVLSVLLLCTACTKNVTFKSYYKGVDYEDPAPTLNKMEELTSLVDLIYAESRGKLLAFQDEENVYFYNADTDAIILNQSKEALLDYALFSVNDHPFILTAVGSETVGYDVEAPAVEAPAEEEMYSLDGYVILDPESFAMVCAELEAAGLPELLEDEEFLLQLMEEGIIMEEPVDIAGEETIGLTVLPEMTIYDASGNVIVTASRAFSHYGDVYDEISVDIDLFEFNNTIYRVADDGKVSTVNDNPFFGGIPDIDYKIGDYYYNTTSCSVSVYDKALNLVLYWETPYDEEEECIIAPLDGKIFIQMLIPVLDSEDEYDLIVDESKHKLNSYIIDAKAGKVKEVDLDYVIVSTDAVYDTEERDSDKANIVMIEDKRLLLAESARKFVSINGSNGNIESVIFSDLYGTATMLVEDRFIYEMYSGDTYLIDGNGKTIGKIDKIRNLSGSNRNENYLLLDGKVYNYNLEMVYDYSEADLDVYGVMGHSVLFQGQGDQIYLYNSNGEIAPLEEGAMVRSFASQYYVLIRDDLLSVYNEDGVELISGIQTTAFREVCRYQDVIFVSVVDESGLRNYKIYADSGKK